MERIPPHIKLKQFSATQIALAMCLGGVVLLVMSLDWPLAVKVFLALMGVGLALGILFLELQGSPLHAWLLGLVRYWVGSHHYVWRRGPAANVTFAQTNPTSCAPSIFQRIWRFASPHVGVGIAVTTAVVGMFLLVQFCQFAFKVERAVTAIAADTTPLPTLTRQPQTQMTKTPTIVASVTPTPVPPATSTSSSHGSLNVVTGWQCPTVLPEQGINTHLYLRAPDKPAWVEVHTSYTNGEISSVGFQVPEGQAAVAVTAPSFVPLSSTLVQGSAGLAVECRTAYWNQPRNDRGKDLAAIWWFPRTSWPNGVHLWFFQLTLPQASVVRLNVMQGEQRLYVRDYALPAGLSKVFLDALAQTKSSESGYLVSSSSPFVAGAAWH